MPRSGTSWIGKIFDSHPDTLYRHEPDSFGSLNAVPMFPPVERAAEHRAVIEGFVERLAGMRSTKVTGTLPIFPKSYYSPVRLRLQQAAVVAAKFAARALGECPVPPLVRHARVPQLRVVWKSIEATGRVGVIVRNVPGMRTVLILRHPCGYVASILRGESQGRFTAREPSSEDYGILEMLLPTPQAREHGLTLERFKAMDPIERLAWRWVLCNEKAMADVDGVAGCTVIRYETLCGDPLGEARKLFAATDLPWHPQTEAFVRASTARDSSAYYSIFKDPIRSATSWRTHLTADQVDRIMTVLEASRLSELFSEDDPRAVERTRGRS
jgi:hypothetical protein